MYNKEIIIPGLIAFVLMVSFPFWSNVLLAGESAEPKVEMPLNGSKHCLLSAEEMKAKHMVILNEWRDDVLRDGNRGKVVIDGKEYDKTLQLACMQCHSNKDEFCDRCHDYASVKPYCWDCHLTPKQQRNGLKEGK